MQTHTCVYAPAGRGSLQGNARQHALACAIISIHTHTYVCIRAGRESVKESQRAVRTLARALTCEAQQAPFVEALGVFLCIQLNRDTHIHLCVFVLYIYRLMHSPGKSSKLALVNHLVSSCIYRYIDMHAYTYTFSSNIFIYIHSPVKSRKHSLLKRIFSS